MSQGTPVHVGDLQQRFAELPPGPWNVPPSEAIVLPFRAPTTSDFRHSSWPVSARAALDDSYRGFFDLVAGQVAAVLSNAWAHEEERKRTRGPGRAGPCQDGVFRERQPRVPYTPLADSRSG